MANQISNVGFMNPDQTESMEIERRRAMAQVLQQQSMQPIEQQQAGGWTVPISPWQGLAKMGQAYAGALTGRKADEQQRALSQKQQDRRGADISLLVNALRGRQASPGGLTEDVAGNVTQTDPMAAQTPSQGLQQALPMLQDPQMQQAGLQAFMQQMKPQEGYTLGPGAQRFGPDNQPLAQAPFKPPEPDKPDEFARMLTAAGIDPQSDEARRIANERLKKMTTHPDATSVKVDVKTGEGLAKEIGPMIAESRNAALGSIETLETVGRIKQAVDSGNINLGPTATIRNARDQFSQLLGVGGKTTEERLVNTRNVIRGLAQFTVSARKALKGQGQVSDYEGKLLTKAESGEIDDFTVPEIKAFIEVTDRMARLRYQQHSRNVDVMKKRPDLSNLVPFYEVPELPAGGANGPLSPQEQQELQELRSRFGRQ